MSRLVDLFTLDGRVLVGRPLTPYPVAVNMGFGIVGQVVTGFSPITTQVQTGWRSTINSNVVTPYNDVWNNMLRRQIANGYWKPSYTTVVTGYAPVYTPLFSPIFSPMSFGGIY